jgi:SHS2 domain-containing protein
MYRWAEHTGEIELSIEASTETGVFVEALAALGELLGEEPGGEKARRELALSAPDPPALLAEWLSELIFLAETESFVPEHVAELEISHSTLHSVVEGRRGEPPPLIKAVTYHRLELAEGDGGWCGRVVLDV